MVFTDVDQRDGLASTRHVLASQGTSIAGTVRLYPLNDAGLWKGDRLAVLPLYRASLVGLKLVRFAVATAAALGGVEMVASIQTANTVFFERLGWRRDGPVASYYGLPHQPMRIELAGAKVNPGDRPEAPQFSLPFPSTDQSPILVGSPPS